MAFAAVPELHRHFPKPQRASPHPCVWQQHGELCGYLRTGFAPHRAFELGTASVILSQSRRVAEQPWCYGEQEPRRSLPRAHTPEHTAVYNSALQHLSAGCCTLQPPSVCLSPKADPLSQEKPENLLLRQLLMCSLACNSRHVAHPNNLRFSFLPSPARQLPCFTPLPSVRDSGFWSLIPLSPHIPTAHSG